MPTTYLRKKKATFLAPCGNAAAGDASSIPGSASLGSASAAFRPDPLNVTTMASAAQEQNDTIFH
jgi:hypothetical protein